MNVAIPDHPALPDRLVVGQKYRRPCVRAHWQGSYITWVPVIGPIHDDRKHIGAAFQHLHVDYRFLRPEIRNALERELHRSPECSNRVFSTPVSDVSPLGLDDPISLDAPHLADVPIAAWLVTRPRVYHGPYPDYPHDATPWTEALHQAYAGQSLIDGTTCPHQGTNLSGFVPDALGVITCPLHGLQWCAKTGKIVYPKLTAPTAAPEHDHHL